MPYKSEAQRKYFNVNRKKLEAQGVDVDEWNEASKGKKMPDRVKESAIAQLAKQAALSSEDINPLDSTLGLALDIMPAINSNAYRRRYGRVRGMAQAANKEVPYRINRPIVSTLTDALLGGVVGSGIGSQFNTSDITPGIVGGGAGAAIGGLAGMLRRRGQSQDIAEHYDVRRELGKLKEPIKPEMSTLRKILHFSDAAGRVGEQQAYEAIKNDKKPEVSPGRTLLDIGTQFLPGGTPMLAALDTYNEIRNTEEKSRKEKIRESIANEKD